ncbi:MAG: prepilin peptidase [Clostridium sp.]|nr:prepilin peptidase [Clostridium sp.]
MIAKLVCLLLLGRLAAEDIREKELSVGMILAAALGGVVYRRVIGQFFWKGMMADILPGAVLVLLSFLTGESIGYGDGALVMTLGLWLGGPSILTMVGVGIMLSGVYGVFCLIKGKKEPIPFVPFLLLGMEATLIYA